MYKYRDFKGELKVMSSSCQYLNKPDDELLPFITAEELAQFISQRDGTECEADGEIIKCGKEFVSPLGFRDVKAKAAKFKVKEF